MRIRVTSSLTEDCQITEIINHELGRRVSLIFEGNDIEVSDGYHTMEELYQHRIILFAALCYVYSGGYKSVGIWSWKSKLHSDGKIPFDDDKYFVAGIESPNGQITYHMKIDKWWDKFDIPELDKAPKYDGHTSEDVLERLMKL